MMLPDVTQEDWNGYQADQFSTGVDRKIGALEFSTAADQRIGALVPDAGATAPSLPTQPPVAPSAPAPSETAASGPSGGMTPDSPVLNLDQPPPYAPDAPLSTPSAASTTSAAALPRSSTAAAPSDLVVQALQAADEAGVDPGLYAQVIQQESSWNPNARSPAGAQGLSQLMPDTARGLGVTDPFDVGQNLKAGARYLRQQIDRFGGDVVKGLAAYNAGAGAVEKYGGVPPFAETQRYVDNIMSAVAQNQGGVGNESPTGGPSLVPEAGQPARPSKDISQFGDPQLTTDEAYAACGPAAAVRFAQRFGRNPTLKEATDLAKTVGWTVQNGMAGLASEQALIAKLPDAVPTKLIQGPQWSQFAAEAQTGNPVIISTAGHYFTADGYDPTSGKFHVGQSGLDLKGGAEWMSPADMQRLMGAVQGGLLADNPQVPAPSTADQGSPNWWDRTKDAIGSTVGNAVSAVGGMFSNEPSTLAGSAGPVSATGEPASLPQSAVDASRQTTNAVGGFFTEEQPWMKNLVQGQTKVMGGEQLTPEQQYAMARGMASGLTQAVVPEDLMARAATTGTGSLARSAQVAQDLAVSRQPAMAEADFASGGLGKLIPDTPVAEIPPVTSAAESAPMPGGVPKIPDRPLPEGTQPITMTAAQETDRLRLDKFPEDVRQVIADNAEQIDWARTQRRGVIPDAEAERLAQQYADDHTLDQVIRQAAPGKAYSTEQIRALRNATAAQAVKVNDAAAAITAGDDSSTALTSFFTEGQRLQRLVQVSEGARAEAGRSLRAFADPAQLVNLSPNDAIARITKTIGGDRQKLLDSVTQYQQLVDSGAGPVQMANFWSALQNPVGAGDWFRLIRYNSMLSGPRSFEINAIGNTLELPWRFARDTGASLVRLRPEELQTELTGAFAGLDRANQRFMETLTNGITSEAAARGEIPRSVSARLATSTSPLAVVGRPVATGLEVPGRLMGAADAWANAIAYSMGMGRLAARQASREGLVGQAWNARVTQILAEPSTSPKLMQEAAGMADRMTYHGDMGNFGQGLQAFTQKTGVIGNLILPFLRTVYHITARGIDRSPVGFIGTGVDVARGAYKVGKPLPKGVAPLGERLGDNLMGSVVFAGVYKEALDGNVSAAGPDDPRRKALLQSEGWQPYSIRVGDRWVSYANWGPAAIPFALAGAAAETQRYAKPGAQPSEMILDGMRRTAQVVTQQTYLQSIGAAWQGMTDPQRYGFQFVNNTIASLIPFGAAINTVGQATDELARRPDRFDIGDAIRNRLPANTPIVGGRESVPAAQDVLGRPAPNTRAGLAALNPLLVSSDRADPVLQELDRAGVSPPGPPPAVSRNGRQVTLTTDEQRQVQADAGGVIANRISVEMNTPSYKALEPEARAKRLQKIVDNARTQAENRFLNTLSDQDYQKRVEQSQIKREPVPVSGR